MNELVAREDINKIAELNGSALNIVVAQMTSLANAVVSDRDDIDGMVESLEKQPWYKRMWNTLTGKNKASKEEIAQKKDQMTGYLIQSVSSLYEMGKINQDIMVSLSQKINDIYYQVSLNSFEQLMLKDSVIKLRNMVGSIAMALNEKIESVDNFNILNKQIEQGVYSGENAISSMCSIMSNMDNRMLTDSRKVDIIRRSMENAGIISDDEKTIAGFMSDIAAIPENKTGEVYLELSSMNGNFWAGLFTELMEKYNMLPKMERMAKKKDVIIKNILDKNDIDESAAFSVSDLYGSFIESRQEMAEMTAKVKIEANSAINATETPITNDNVPIVADKNSCNESPFELQIKKNDEKIKEIIYSVFGEDDDECFDVAFEIDFDECSASDEAVMLISIIEAELVFYYFQEKLDETQCQKLIQNPDLFIKENYEKHSKKLDTDLLWMLFDMTDYMPDDFTINDLENTFIKNRRNTLEKIYNDCRYQHMLNSNSIRRIFDRVLEKGKEYKADEFCTLLTKTYPELGQELADIITKECSMGSRKGDFLFYYHISKILYDYHDDNYYKMSAEELYDKLVNYRDAFCNDFSDEMNNDPLGSPVKVRTDDYEYECNDHYSTFKRSVIGNGQPLRNVEIEYFTTRIGKNAFFGHNEIRNIVIPNSIEEIDDYAFGEACTDAVIVIPDSVHTISRYAFNNCYAKKIYICDWAKVTEITFDCCSFERVVLSRRLEKVEISQCNSLVTLDLKNIFPYDAEVWLCNRLETVIFHNDQSDDDFFMTYHFFSNCPKLNNLYFPRDFRRNLVNGIVETICSNNEGMTPSDLKIIYF